jgi:hypothetical protein
MQRFQQATFGRNAVAARKEKSAIRQSPEMAALGGDRFGL